MTDRQNQKERPSDLVALCAAIVAETAAHLPRALVDGLSRVYKSFKPMEGAEMGDISPRGIRSAMAAFHLKLGTNPAELSERPGVSGAQPFTPRLAVAAMQDAVSRSFQSVEGGDPKDTEENRRSRLASAGGYFLTELYAVAATEWHNAAADASIRDGDERACHVVAQSVDPTQAMMRQLLGASVAPAAEFLATPCGLVSVAEGLARVPQERRLAAAAEIIRYLNVISNGSHADVDRLIDVAVDIYG